MNKPIILLLIFGTIGTTYGSLMDPVNNFILQNLLVIEGRAEVPGDFICECPTDPPTTCPTNDPFCNRCVDSDFGTVSQPGPFFNSAGICGFVPPP